ncbi:crotonase/enoyl-CoA hydratase family protein [Alphaproteobacteria bacterium]|nr:crotonase/enoyl-CoA hydratase family protein [Alphaproteobacteria bacterium]
MKAISEKLIKPIIEADNNEGRINRKLIQNIFFIDIDRPKKLNGFTPYMFKEIAKSFTEYENDNNALCAVVYTSGKHFCAGMDLKKVSPFLKKGNHNYIHPKGYIDPLGLKNKKRSKPLICAVKGITFTYGLELMLAADIALAENNTRFAMLEAKRGLLMTGGATIRFIERSGWSNAMKYLLTGIEFDSKEALRMNLIQEILDEKKLFTRAVELAGQICNSSHNAVKEILKNSNIALNDHKKAIKQLDEVQNKLIKGADFKEGLKSFIEKRPSRFLK